MLSFSLAYCILNTMCQSYCEVLIHIISFNMGSSEEGVDWRVASPTRDLGCLPLESRLSVIRMDISQGPQLAGLDRQLLCLLLINPFSFAKLCS